MRDRREVTEGFPNVNTLFINLCFIPLIGNVVVLEIQQRQPKWEKSERTLQNIQTQGQISNPAPYPCQLLPPYPRRPGHPDLMSTSAV